MSVLETLVGFIAPPDCLACGAEGSALCRSCSAVVIKPFGVRCWRCNRLSAGARTCEPCRRAGGPAHAWISTVYEDMAQELIQSYKFSHMRPAARSLAGIMAETLTNSEGDIRDYLLVPVPTATSRARQRGFGHSELLAKQIAAQLGLPCSPALRRLGQSRQLGSTRESRLKQLEGQFIPKNPKLVKAQKILLVDDVLTTGGTLVAATRALRAAGARQVDALVFAKRL